MAKASDNVFPKLIVSEGTTPSSPAAGSQKLFIDSADHKLKRVDSSGAVSTVEGGSSGGTSSGGILAYTAYSAPSNYTKANGATHAQVDSTNLVVTFTAPSTGRVLIELSALLGGPTTVGQWVEYSLFESGTILAGTTRQVIQGTNPLLQQLSRHAITGLTPGSVHTYAWGWRAANCTATMYNDPTLMTVTALP
jgi:hypothetical protein